MKDKSKYRSFILKLVGGDSVYSIIFYLVVFYIAFVYILLPSVYAFTPVSYISAVVSGSMVHQEPQINSTYYGWLKVHGFNMSTVNSWPFFNGIPVGSIAVAYKALPSQIRVGDVIIYHINYEGLNEDVIHRVVNETEINGTYYYTTKGDANPFSLPFEYNVPYSHLVGKVEYVIPYLGYPKYVMYSISQGV
jgi:signal peptidase I